VYFVQIDRLITEVVGVFVRVFLLRRFSSNEFR
jgi:hypothetical protein